MDERNPELAHEFKTAAMAVTKLFKVASQNSKQVYEQGYTDALRHLLDYLDTDPDGDVQTWAVRQLTGITQEDADMSLHDSDDGAAGEKRAHHGTAKSKRQKGFPGHQGHLE